VRCVAGVDGLTLRLRLFYDESADVAPNLTPVDLLGPVAEIALRDPEEIYRDQWPLVWHPITPRVPGQGRSRA